MDRIFPVVLAAGKGERMNSKIPKVLHKICGLPMLHYPISVLKNIGLKNIIVVVGYKKELIYEIFSKDVYFSHQDKPLGTAHALLCAKDRLFGEKGDLLVLCGDTPLITEGTIKDFIENHRKSKAFASCIVFKPKDKKGYGRVIIEDGQIKRIVEESDLKGEETEFVNSGIYLFKLPEIFQILSKIEPSKKGEYYLTDVIHIAHKFGYKTIPYFGEEEEFLGVNTRYDLQRAQKILFLRKAFSLLDHVTIFSPEDTYIEPSVSVGKDSIIYPFSFLLGSTKIGEDTKIGVGCVIKDSIVGRGVEIEPYSVIEDSVIEDGAKIGPFARLRPGTQIGKDAKIGNFVEVKNSRIGDGTKAAHLSYIGDALVGSSVNIGAGTITCNYDGKKKHKTIIGDRVFIGSDTQFVAPVKVGEGAYIGAGSTITEDVPENTLAIARSRQVIKRKRK